MLKGDIVLYIDQYGNGTLSGSQTVLSQSKFGDDSDLHYYGGSVSSVPFSVYANPPGKFLLLDATNGSNFLGCYVNILDSGKYFKSKVPCFSDEFVLSATTLSKNSMSGKWAIRNENEPQGYGAVYLEDGSFTLSKVG